MKIVWSIGIVIFLFAACTNNSGQLVDKSESSKNDTVQPPANSSSTAELPAGHPPINQTNKQAMDVNPNTGGAPKAAIEGNRAIVAGLSFVISPKWVSQPPSSSMRAAQFSLPPVDGDTEGGELVLFSGNMGSVQMNLERWIGQFSDAGQPIQEQKQVGTFTVHLLDITGTFSAGGMMMSQSTPKSDQRMLAAIVVSPSHTWYFKLTGPKATIENWKPNFLELVDSLTPAN